MKKSKMKESTSKMMKKNLINLPTPSNISYSWNMGSMLGIIMSIQSITGIILSMHFTPSTESAFQSYNSISKNTWMGFYFKFSHSSMASIIFIILLIHIFRNMLNFSFKNKPMWNSGFMLLLMTMVSAFLGYVLPWGQMSMWGATVICNMMSSIPIIGNKMVFWLWGNFSVSQPTLKRFMTLHFILPLLIMAMSMLHMIILHVKGSSSNLSSNPQKDKIEFNKKFSLKDMITIIMMMSSIKMMSNSNPFSMMDPENFNMANQMMTPNHIMPEWYFLFAYSILRSIPNKMGGIMMMIMSIMSLAMLQMKKKSNKSKFNPSEKNKNMMKSTLFFMLTFTGSKQIEKPFSLMSIILSLMFIPTILW